MNMSKRFTSVRIGVIRALAAGALGMTTTWVLAQPISDVPLPVKNNVPPNFMFMIDSSSSMHNITVGAPYDAGATYALDFTCGGSGVAQMGNGSTINLRIDTTGTFQNRPTFNTDASGTRYRAFGTNNTTYARRCFNPTLIYRARLFTDSESGGVRGHSNYGTATYSGHFLNWYFSTHGSGTTGWDKKKPTAGDLLKSRIEISKEEAKLLLTNPLKTGDLTATPRKPISVRVGLSQYYEENSTDGGALLVGMGDLTATHKATLETAIDNLVAKGSTPLAETHGDIGRYMATGYTGNVTLPSGWSGTSIDSVLKQGGPSTGRNSCLASGIAAGASRTCTGNDAIPVPATGTPTRPIQYWCQRSYAFLLTDGLPTRDTGFTDNTYIGGYAGLASVRPTGDYVDNYFLNDISKALFDLDLRPNLQPPTGVSKLDKNGKPLTNLRTYTFGFGDADVTESPLLKKTAEVGGGLFVGATSRAQLQTGFRKALADAFNNESASAAVNVVSSDVRTSGGVGYAATYQSGQWYGDLEAYQISTAGSRTSTTYWSAKAKLDLAISFDPSGSGFASRKIASFDGTTGLAFNSTNFPGLEQTSGVADPAKAGLVDYLRGDRSKEGGATNNFRSRTHALGDTINARPLVVDYAGVPIVFQGANDGMLHVIDGRTDGATTNGAELWAYVPRLVHANLADLASQGYSHRYYVDAGPVAAQVSGVNRGTPPAAVSRLLVGGLGKGGRGYYALDISTYAAADAAAAANKAMWEFGAAQTNMGYSFGQPMIVRTAAGWRVLVTSGYDNGSALGGDGRGYMWVLDPSDGTVLKRFATGVGTTATPSGLAHLSVKNGTAADAVVRFVYGGDLYGNVWRFDLDATSAGDITPSRLATLADPSGTAQPITAAVQVGPVDGSGSRVFVYVGTGRYFDDQDVPGSTGEVAAIARQQQSLYGLIDDTSQANPTPITVTRSSSGCGADGGNGTLACQSLTYKSATNKYDASRNRADLSTKSGWYLDWPQDSRLSNARVTGKPFLSSGGTLAMSVNVPAELRCQPGGTSWLFQVYGQTGGDVPKTIPGDDYFGDSGVYLGPFLASELVGLTGKDAAGKDITAVQGQGSNGDTFGGIINNPAAGAPAPRLIYWRSVR
jgi:type IV pilus assembly protein PilY1